MESLELEKLGVWSNCLRENSEVFNSEFLVWGIVQNGKIGVETSENWFSEVSEFSENSEFSTSPVKFRREYRLDQKVLRFSLSSE